jgi:hypothetical protein
VYNKISHRKSQIKKASGHTESSKRNYLSGEAVPLKKILLYLLAENTLSP